MSPDLSLFPDAVPIPGYAGMYASPDGRILSVRQGRPRLRKTYLFKGHVRVNLTNDDGTHEPARVHQLIAVTFAGPRPTPEHGAIHINGNKDDNRADNVKWALAAEKVARQVTRGTHIKGEKHPQAKLNDDLVREIRQRAARGATDRELGNRYGVSKGCIGYVVRRKTWKHVGNEPNPTALASRDLAGATEQGTTPGAGGGF